MNSALDMPSAIQTKDLDILDKVDDIVHLVSKEKNPLIASKYVEDLRSGVAVRGLALAKLLAKMDEIWIPIFKEEGRYDEDFVDFAYTQMGIAPATVKKYIRMWNAIFENESIPEKVRDRLRGRGMKTLLLLTGGAREGSFDEDTWRKIAAEPHQAGVAEVIREARGKKTSSTTRIVIMLERDGTLKARRGRKAFQDFGYFNLEKIAEDPDLQAAFDRILRVGIVER